MKAARDQEVCGLEGVVYGIGHYAGMSRKLLHLCLLLLFAFVLSLSGLLVLALREEHPVYFGVNQEMQIMPMYPLSEPLYSDAALTSWAAQTAIAIFNLDFLHWREQLAASRSAFTKKAYLGFRRSLQDEGHLRILSQYRALMHGIIAGMPVIVAKGMLENRMTWEVEVPFALAFETSDRVLSRQSFLISMRIQRVSTAEYVKGIAICQMIVVEKSPLASWPAARS
ncbi:MAG: DotI/IcmL family type IV secretion protein [Desulfovibrio sp.]|nr:DotI/IcmL family type IV secretion protein [Desulfovibrio sp.]